MARAAGLCILPGAGPCCCGAARKGRQVASRFPADTTPRYVTGLAVAVALPELVVLGADLGLWGTVLWRPLSYQYGAFWAGLLHGWTPNYAVQPVTMFLTHAVLHSGPGHLIGNLLGILPLGRLAAERLGRAGFLLACLLIVLGGGLAFGLLSRSPQPMVGASGLVFGLAGIWAWGLVQDRRSEGRGVWGALWPFAAITLGLALFNLVSFVLLRGLLAWETHLGGYLAGVLCALWAGRHQKGRIT